MSPAPPPCPACGAPTAPWLSAPASELGVGDVALARCSSCGTAVTLDPIPGDIDVHETGDYATAAPRGAGPAAPILRAFDRQRLSYVRWSVPPTPAGDVALIDAGAGRGRFVDHARGHGYPAATGVEPTARGVDVARARYGLSLERASIADAAVVPGSADAVTLWHVLEHVDDPGATLAQLHAWLRPGGALIIGVPNLASWQARAGGPRWFHLDLPRHRTHFTARGLKRLLEAQGFEVVRVAHVLAEHNPYGMWQSFVSRWTQRPSYLFHLLKRNAPLDTRDLAITVAALPLLPLAIVAELLAGLARRGGTVAVIARRRV